MAGIQMDGEVRSVHRNRDVAAPSMARADLQLPGEKSKTQKKRKVQGKCCHFYLILSELLEF